MTLRRKIPASFLGACALVLAACATGGSQGTVMAGGGVAVQVANDLVPPSAITVWVVPETGSRRRLGTVSPNALETFTFSPGIASMEHRLVAETTGGTDHTSNPFSFADAAGVRWSVSSTLVSVDRGRE